MFDRKFQWKEAERPRNNSLGEKNSPPKRQRLESELSQGDIEEVKDESEDETVEVVEKTTIDPG